jgi:hypothetical protein
MLYEQVLTMLGCCVGRLGDPGIWCNEAVNRCYINDAPAAFSRPVVSGLPFFLVFVSSEYQTFWKLTLVLS